MSDARDPLIDSGRNPTTDSHRNPYTGANKVCCCSCAYHRLYRCDDLSETDLYIAHPDIHGFSLKLSGDPDTCYFLRGCYTSLPEEGGLASVAEWFPACELCNPTFSCSPDVDEALTDEELEALYPDVTAIVAGLSVCACYKEGPDSSVETTETVNGHGFLLIPGGVVRDGGVGHGQTYHLEEATPTGPGYFSGTRWFTSTDCTHTDFSEVKADSLMVFDITLMCRLFAEEDVDPSQNHTNGWAFSVGAVGVGGNLTDCFDVGPGPYTYPGPMGGPWSGHGGVITSVPNLQNVDGDCDATTGTGQQDPCGGGACAFIAS